MALTLGQYLAQEARKDGTELTPDQAEAIAEAAFETLQRAFAKLGWVVPDSLRTLYWAVVKDSN
jgi:hypothetical protein